eukprot:746084-Hanusia_phi.AAC.1
MQTSQSHIGDVVTRARTKESSTRIRSLTTSMKTLHTKIFTATRATNMVEKGESPPSIAVYHLSMSPQPPSRLCSLVKGESGQEGRVIPCAGWDDQRA